MIQTCRRRSTCRLEIVAVEGSIRRIRRTCGKSGENDTHELQCTTSSSYVSYYGTVNRTTCTSVCSTDGCNNQPASNLTDCAFGCSGNGKCVEGICVCNGGYKGTDCSNQVPVGCYVCQDSSGLDDSNPDPCYNNPTGMIQACTRPATCRLEIVAEHGN
uniref:Major surface trophozoite antigen 11-like n=1 Tax=Phallusia mammillata TaxID=59560 RepID=A0A6F9DVY2_9ASCI|nr:major surface trophozoite antigen 11-like [Phallusia mammillata]